MSEVSSVDTEGGLLKLLVPIQVSTLDKQMFPPWLCVKRTMTHRQRMYYLLVSGHSQLVWYILNQYGFDAGRFEAIMGFIEAEVLQE